MSEHLGKSVKIFLTEGTPNGILTAEIINWTGHVLSAPRAKLAGLLKRQELEKAGVYLLIGIGEDGQNIAYIGESLNVGKRLTQHNKDEKKDFWEKTFVVTSKDSNLTSGHIKYIESKLIGIAKQSAQIELTNDTAPDHSNLPEADIADMNYFIMQIRLILPILGLEFLRETATEIVKDKDEAVHSQIDAMANSLPNNEIKINQAIEFELIIPRRNVHAFATEINGEFIVLKGSTCAGKNLAENNRSTPQIYFDLVRSGRILQNPDGKTGVFTQNVSFRSPSAASGAVAASSTNGRILWKIKGTNQTYAEWQESQLPELKGIEE